MFADGIGNGLHLLCRKLQLGIGEEHIALALHRDEMDVSVGHFKTKDGLTHFHAWNYLLDGTGHTCCKDMEAGDFIVLKVEDIVYLATWNNKRMALDHRVDIEECVELLVGGTAITGNLAGSYLTENTHNLIL